MAFTIVATGLLALGIAEAQVASPSPNNSDNNPESSQLAAENAYYQVTRLLLPGASTVKVLQHGHDAVIVVVGDGVAELTLPKSTESLKLKNGDVKFSPNGASPSLSNEGPTTLEILVVELKHHWNAEIRPCSVFANCTRSIGGGNVEIGETTSLFSNGFISAYRHRLTAGGSLTSSYFSSKRKDHLLFIPLAALKANFDGTGEDLKRGQVYPLEASEVEVTAGTHEIRWVVIRMQTPKP